MSEHISGAPGELQVRMYDGELDEIVVRDCDLHLERMEDNSWWMGITLADGKQTMLMVNIGAKRAKVDAWVELDESDEPAWWKTAVSNRNSVTGGTIDDQ